MSLVQSRPKKKNSLRYTYGGTKRRKPLVDEDAEIARTGEIGKYSSSRFYAVPIVRDKAEIQPTQIKTQSEALIIAVPEPIEIESPALGSSLQQLRTILERANQQSTEQMRRTLGGPMLDVQQRLQNALREAVKLPKPVVLQMPEFKIVLPKLKLIDPSTIKLVKGPIFDTQAFQRTFRDLFAQQVQITRDAIKLSISNPDMQLSLPDQQIDSLLTLLRSGLELPSDEAINAVLEIQTTSIPEGDLEETVELLVSFIRKHRATNSQRVLIAVGAAIRKVLLNIADEQLGLAAELMKSSGSLEVPIEVELEVAKMVVHRFRYAPNTSTVGLSDLAELLLENAKDYSKAKQVNREYYGATALNSILSIVLMKHKEASALFEHVKAVSAAWFVDLVKSRLRRMAKEIENDCLEGSGLVIELMRTLGSKSADDGSSKGDR